VWEENWQSFEIFLKMQTQWNVTMGGYVGLKYEVLQWVSQLYDVEDKRRLLEDIQVMETAALSELNKKDG